MKSTTHDRLVALFAEYPILVAGPVEESKVKTLEKFAGFTLPNDYIDFVRSYGGAVVGEFPIYGMRRAHVMAKGAISAIAMTNFFRRQKWSAIDEWLIISMNLSGSPIGLNRSGEIWLADHEWGKIECVSPTFEQFIIGQCLKE